MDDILRKIPPLGKSLVTLEICSIPGLEQGSTAHVGETRLRTRPPFSFKEHSFDEVLHSNDIARKRPCRKAPTRTLSSACAEPQITRSPPEWSFLYCVTVIAKPELTILPFESVWREMLSVKRRNDIPMDRNLTASDIENASRHIGGRIVLLEGDGRTVSHHGDPLLENAAFMAVRCGRFEAGVFGPEMDQMLWPFQEVVAHARLIQ